MLFSTGIGTTILYWGAIEWIEYYLAPPYEMPPRSEDALKWSTPYGMFHWGIIGWALYCFPAVCLGYAYHVHQGESLNLSTACRPILAGDKENISSRIVDVLFMVGLLGSSATGIGLTTPLITESFSKFFGVSHSVWLTMGAVGLVLVVIVLSVHAGLEKGIRKLSNLNMILLVLLLMLIVVLGPTKYIFSQGLKNGWFMLTHLTEMGGVYYPSKNKAFTESWTVFYWAWWLSLGPFVGMFICKISRGRTLRQLILSVLFFRHTWMHYVCGYFKRLFYVPRTRTRNGGHRFFREEQALSSDSNNNLVTTWGLDSTFVLFALYLLCCDYL